ncbi:COG4223 family protein [Bartonella senegalensis]|uniref:COG4223 family protein n=1 Tax=Bartonella senegalensis TaxID=1468418 RepID=UPI0002F0E417|nr:membrane protein [Bartonella senegalensis]
MADSPKPKDKPHYTGVRPKKPVIEQDIISHDSEQKTQNSVEADRIETGKIEKQSTQSKSILGMTWLFLPISGIFGGLIALSLFIGLQWAGLLPSSLLGNHMGEENALQIAETAKSQSEETRRQLKHVLQEIDSLKAEFSSFSSRQLGTFQNDKASQEESRKAFAALEEKVSGLEEYVLTLVGVSKEMKTALLVGQNNASALTALTQRLETLQKEIAVKSEEKEKKNTALFIAINSLKNAVERGGSYVNELKILQQLLPSIEGIDLLQKTASIGFPSPAQLAADFANVADTIVATQKTVVSDASFFEQILAWMKGLIVSRPIGNVEGMTLGAIAARMEVAIQTGDYEKALSEWQTLPQTAKDVSVDFVHQLERYVAVHNLLDQLLLSAQQGSFEAKKM